MLSAVIRTKDEEENIERSVRSLLDVADEIIVVDSGSKDRTVEIAESLGAKVYFKEWEGYSNQLNYGISLCQGDWILVVDADEELSEELRLSIRQALDSPMYNLYMVNRRTYYLGSFLKHAWQPEWRVRLFKKGCVRIEGELHESYIYSGKAGKLKGFLNHYSFKSLYHQSEKTIKYSKIMALSMKRKGKRFRFYNLLFNPLWDSFKVYVIKLGFLDGWRGFLVAFFVFLYVFLKYLFLLELELEEKHGGELWK